MIKNWNTKLTFVSLTYFRKKTFFTPHEDLTASCLYPSITAFVQAVFSVILNVENFKFYLIGTKKETLNSELNKKY